MITKEGILQRLQFERAKGSANICPKCKKQGHFGSVSRFEDSDADYLICGWCFEITEVIKK